MTQATTQKTLTDDEFRRASQILEAMKQGHATTPRYNPRDDPEKPHFEDPNYLETVRQFCVEAVYSIWNQHKRATRNRAEIVPIVQQKPNRKLF